MEGQARVAEQSLPHPIALPDRHRGPASSEAIPLHAFCVAPSASHFTTSQTSRSRAHNWARFQFSRPFRQLNLDKNSYKENQLNIAYKPALSSESELIMPNQKKMAKDNIKWSEHVYTQHKSQRVNALKELIAHRGISKCWHLVGYVWCNTNNHLEHADFWKDVWLGAYSQTGSIRKSASFLMGTADRSIFNNLPALVTAYRGCLAYEDDFDLDVHVLGDSDVAGHSWTLDLNCAMWFARRKHDCGRSDFPAVAKKIFRRDQIVAYFNELNEQEIVIPTHVVEWGIYVDELVILNPNDERPSRPGAS